MTDCGEALTALRSHTEDLATRLTVWEARCCAGDAANASDAAIRELHSA